MKPQSMLLLSFVLKVQIQAHRSGVIVDERHKNWNFFSKRKFELQNFRGWALSKSQRSGWAVCVCASFHRIVAERSTRTYVWLKIQMSAFRIDGEALSLRNEADIWSLNIRGCWKCHRGKRATEKGGRGVGGGERFVALMRGYHRGAWLAAVWDAESLQSVSPRRHFQQSPTAGPGQTLSKKRRETSAIRVKLCARKRRKQWLGWVCTWQSCRKHI